jgi:hypothetical protein
LGQAGRQASKQGLTDYIGDSAVPKPPTFQATT